MPGVLCKYFTINTCRQKSKTLHLGHYKPGSLSILTLLWGKRATGEQSEQQVSSPCWGTTPQTCTQSLLLLVSWDHGCHPAQPHLHSVNNGCHCLLGDIVQPMLICSYNHPSFQLATCWQHHGVRAQLQIIIFLRILCHKLLGSRQWILRLEPVLSWT